MTRVKPKPVNPLTVKEFIAALAEYFEREYNRIQVDQISRKVMIYTDYFRGLLFLEIIHMDMKYVRKPMVTEIGIAAGTVLQERSHLKPSQIFEGAEDE